MLSQDALLEMERLAVRLVGVAGAEIESAFGRQIDVRYKKTSPSEYSLGEPVSEIDLKIEGILRENLARFYPSHGIIGEEFEKESKSDSDIVWAIDPIDGTDNFVNGFPLFSSSLSALYQGRPIVGALWCSTSHLLRSGIYHAHAGGEVKFEGQHISFARNNVRRGLLGGNPRLLVDADLSWSVRQTGSAAIECVFVASGMLQIARFTHANVWDIGAGVALVQAAGHEVRHKTEAGWEQLRQLPVSHARRPYWPADIVLGDARSVFQLCKALEHGRI